MALRNIVKKGDECLNKKCREVTDFNGRLHKLLDDMRDTLIESNGVGLAAPQVGVLRRVVLVMDTNNDDEIIELINPEIIEFDGEQEGPEGCLSVPGVWGIVKRPYWVKVKAQDRNGEWFEVEGDGLTGRCFCHEIDHLSGVLFDMRAERMLTPEEIQAMSAAEDEDYEDYEEEE
ncbi:MAG: peptide deformylase [Oscillospiraceae bacterium]|nr:peptide deformylase [Oscillospiraceae bacterium]